MSESMPIGQKKVVIEISSDRWGITVREVPKLLADTEFPEIAGKEFDPGPPLPEEEWGKVMWPNIPRVYLNRESLRLIYANKLAEMIHWGKITRCSQFTKSELTPGWPQPDEVLTIDEFEKFVKTVKKNVSIRFMPTIASSSVVPAESKANQAGIRSDSNDWKEQARKIADEFFDLDTKAGCRNSLTGYSRRVMKEMQKREIYGPRGRITNANTVQREALQGKKWWANKTK